MAITTTVVTTASSADGLLADALPSTAADLHTWDGALFYFDFLCSPHFPRFVLCERISFGAEMEGGSLNDDF